MINRNIDSDLRIIRIVVDTGHTQIAGTSVVVIIGLSVSLDPVVDHNHGSAAVNQNGADLEQIAGGSLITGVVEVQLAQEPLQIGGAGTVGGAGLAVVLLDQHGLHILMDIEALLSVSVDVQRAALQAGRIVLTHNALVGGLVVAGRRTAGGNAVVVGAEAPDLLVEDSGLAGVGNRLLHVLDVIHEVLVFDIAFCFSSRSENQNLVVSRGRLAADALAGLGIVGVLHVLHSTVGLVGNLVPDVLVHVLQLAQAAAALFNQVNGLAVVDDLAGPSPLVILSGVGLALDAVVVGVHQLLGGTVVLAQQNSGDDITVIVKQGVNIARIGSGGAVVGRLFDFGGTGKGRDLHVVDAGAQAVHTADHNYGLVSRQLRTKITTGHREALVNNVLGADFLHLGHQVDGGVVAVDIGTAVGSSQGDALGTDLLAGGVHIRVLAGLGGLVGGLGRGEVAHLSQGIGAVLVHGVGAPSVPQGVALELALGLGSSIVGSRTGRVDGITIGIRPSLTVLHVHLEVDERAVQQDAGRLGGLGVQVAVA